jgi:hypothetical protein
MLPILLAGVLAAEVTGIAIARSVIPSEPVSSSADGPIAASTMSAGRLRDDLVSVTSVAAGPTRAADSRRDPRVVLAEIAHRRSSSPVRPLNPPSAPRSQASASPNSQVRAVAPKTTSTVRYAGRNHVWIPSLGINRSVSSFACTRSQPPDNYIYRWGCAGRNNVYLLGHAYSVFKPLHDAYVSGRLRKGMKVVYADALGHVHSYAVIWWRVVAPTTAASWAWAPQSRPSMTLQTCVGANSRYRLMVRLVQVG